MEKENLRATYSISVLEDNFININFLSSPSDVADNDDRALLVEGDITEILNAKKDIAFKMKVNILNMGETHITQTANDTYRRIASMPQFTKIAVVGEGRLHTKVLNFVIPFIRLDEKKVQWFADEGEADTWLAEAS